MQRRRQSEQQRSKYRGPQTEQQHRHVQTDHRFVRYRAIRNHRYQSFDPPVREQAAYSRAAQRQCRHAAVAPRPLLLPAPRHDDARGFRQR